MNEWTFERLERYYEDIYDNANKCGKNNLARINKVLEAIRAQIPRELDEDDMCQNCGNFVEEDYIYCPYCGQKIKED